MREKKEIRTIANSEEVMEEMSQIYTDGMYLKEYGKLLNDYKKLFKRYEKTMKVSDSISNSIMKENDILSENLLYTIKTARTNLFKNLSEHRKTKDLLHNNKDKILQNESEMNQLLQEKKDLQIKLDKYADHLGEVKQDISIIKPKIFNNISIEKVISLAFSHNEDNQFLMKLQLKNFDNILQIVHGKSTIEDFIEIVYCFLETNLSEDSTVYYQNKGMFYVCIVNEELSMIKLLEQKINNKRDIYDFQIDFNMAVSQHKLGEDSIKNLVKECDEGLEEALSRDIFIAT